MGFYRRKERIIVFITIFFGESLMTRMYNKKTNKHQMHKQTRIYKYGSSSQPSFHGGIFCNILGSPDHI